MFRRDAQVRDMKCKKKTDFQYANRHQVCDMQVLRSTQRAQISEEHLWEFRCRFNDTQVILTAHTKGNTERVPPSF